MELRLKIQQGQRGNFQLCSEVSKSPNSVDINTYKKNSVDINVDDLSRDLPRRLFMIDSNDLSREEVSAKEIKEALFFERPQSP